MAEPRNPSSVPGNVYRELDRLKSGAIFDFKGALVKVHRLEWRDYRFGPKLYLKALNGTEIETTLIEFRDEAKTLPEEHLARILFDK